MIMLSDSGRVQAETWAYLGLVNALKRNAPCHAVQRADAGDGLPLTASMLSSFKHASRSSSH
jgi:hypothetical protein